METASPAPGTAAVVEQHIRNVCQDPQASGFILDFDGTLSAIAPTPDAARALPEAAAVLESLARRYRLVAIVSGRRAQDVHDLIAVPLVRYLGLYGAEEMTGGGAPQPGRTGARETAAALVAEANEFLKADPTGLAGCQVEDKGLSVGLHFRRAVSPDAGEILAAWAAARASSLGYQLRPGRMVVEITPPGPTKAEAAERLIASEGLRHVVMAGDDVADVGALRRAGELLGRCALRIGVRSVEGPPELAEVSDVMVPGPQGVVDLLKQFA